MKAKTRLIFDNSWLDKIKFVNHTDEDLMDVCSAIAVKSSTGKVFDFYRGCLLYTSPSPRDAHESRMPSSA